jgi:hypothetical protein
MALFFTSDTHFRDARVMRIARRPFANVADHDASLIELWNETVQEQDEVWHLGDFAKGTIDQIAELLFQLKGGKHLIIGNNDSEATVPGARMVERATLQGADRGDPAHHIVPLPVPQLEQNGTKVDRPPWSLAREIETDSQTI